MELIQWEIPALLWEKRNSIVKFSKRVPTKIEQVCPNLTEVISEQTSNLPFLHALERQSKGKLPPFCPRRGLDPNCRGGRKVGRRILLDSSYQTAQRMRLKKREKDESLIRRRKLLPGRGSNPFSPKREWRGRPCWVASAIFGHTRTKKAG